AAAIDRSRQRTRSRLGPDDQLVEIGVWMPAVDVAFAPCAGVELTTAKCCTLEVQHPDGAKPACSQAGIHNRLRQVSLGQRSIPGCVRSARNESDRARIDVEGYAGALRARGLSRERKYAGEKDGPGPTNHHRGSAAAVLMSDYGDDVRG